jgi:VanZ family protein
MDKGQRVRYPVSQAIGPDWGGFVWYWIPLLLVATGMIYLSSLSVPQQELVVFLNTVHSLIPIESAIFFTNNDKVYHLIEYAILAVLTYRAFHYSRKGQSDAFVVFLTIACVVLFGCTDELHQWFVPLRDSDVWDLMADALGGILGVGVWKAVLNFPAIRFLEERIPLKLQVALGIHVLKISS